MLVMLVVQLCQIPVARARKRWAMRVSYPGFPGQARRIGDLPRPPG